MANLKIVLGNFCYFSSKDLQDVVFFLFLFSLQAPSWDMNWFGVLNMHESATPAVVGASLHFCDGAACIPLLGDACDGCGNYSRSIRCACTLLGVVCYVCGVWIIYSRTHRVVCVSKTVSKTVVTFIIPLCGGDTQRMCVHGGIISLRARRLTLLLVHWGLIKGVRSER